MGVARLRFERVVGIASSSPQPETTKPTNVKSENGVFDRKDEVVDDSGVLFGSEICVIHDRAICAGISFAILIELQKNYKNLRTRKLSRSTSQEMTHKVSFPLVEPVER